MLLNFLGGAQGPTPFPAPFSRSQHCQGERKQDAHFPGSACGPESSPSRVPRARSATCLESRG